MSVRGRKIMIGQRRKQMVQGMVANRKRKEQPREKISPRVVARVKYVFGEIEFLSVRLEMMIGYQSHLVKQEDADPQAIQQRRNRVQGVSPITTAIGINVARIQQSNSMTVIVLRSRGVTLRTYNQFIVRDEARVSAHSRSLGCRKVSGARKNRRKTTNGKRRIIPT